MIPREKENLSFRTLSRYGIGLLAVLIVTGVLRLSIDSASRSDQANVTAVGSNSKPISLPDVNRFATKHSRTEDVWQRRWRELDGLNDAALRAQKREALIEELAALDPPKALDFALTETNESLRMNLLEAAMCGWGKADPEAALRWSLSQQLMDSGQAMASVFNGAGHDPENAIRLAKKMSEQDPQRAGDYGSYLVGALGRSGEFSKAAEFAANGPEGARMDWLGVAYSRWAKNDPRAALESATKLSDPDSRKTALNMTLSQWANKDPRAVAQYALDLSDPSARQFAFATALPNWAAANPVEAASWLNGIDPSPELDLGAASVATRPEAIRQPEVALSWAENILDARLRGRVLASVIHRWAKADAAAARQYAEKSPNVRAEDRAEILSAFEPGFDPISLEP